MRPLHCLSGDVSLYDSINCNPEVLGEASEKPSTLWDSSTIHQATATQQLVNPYEDTCDYFNPNAAIIAYCFLFLNWD